MFALFFKPAIIIGAAAVAAAIANPGGIESIFASSTEAPTSSSGASHVEMFEEPKPKTSTISDLPRAASSTSTSEWPSTAATTKIAGTAAAGAAYAAASTSTPAELDLARQWQQENMLLSRSNSNGQSHRQAPPSASGMSYLETLNELNPSPSSSTGSYLDNISGAAYSNPCTTTPGASFASASASSADTMSHLVTPNPATGAPLELSNPDAKDGSMSTNAYNGIAKAPAPSTSSALFSSVGAQLDAAPISISTKIERLKAELELAKQWQEREMMNGFKPAPPLVNGHNPARASMMNPPKFPDPPTISSPKFPSANGSSAPVGQKINRLKNELDLARKFFDEL